MSTFTSTITPRLRVSRNPQGYQEHSQVAPSSDAGPSRLPEVTQLVDVRLSDMEGSEGSSYKRWGSATPRAPPQHRSSTSSKDGSTADSLRALTARLPPFPSTSAPAQHSRHRDSSDDESEMHASERTTTTSRSVAQENLRAVFSFALRDPGDTPQKPKPQKYSQEDSDMDISPAPTRQDKGKGRMPDEEGDSTRILNRLESRTKAVSQPVTLELLRERFGQSHNSYAFDMSTDSEHESEREPVHDDLNGSQASLPAATSTPLPSSRISYNSQFQSNLLGHNTEMAGAFDGLDSDDAHYRRVPDSPPPQLRKRLPAVSESSRAIPSKSTLNSSKTPMPARPAAREVLPDLESDSDVNQHEDSRFSLRSASHRPRVSDTPPMSPPQPSARLPPSDSEYSPTNRPSSRLERLYEEPATPSFALAPSNYSGRPRSRANSTASDFTALAASGSRSRNQKPSPSNTETPGSYTPVAIRRFPTRSPSPLAARRIERVATPEPRPRTSPGSPQEHASDSTAEVLERRPSSRLSTIGGATPRDWTQGGVSRRQEAEDERLDSRYSSHPRDRTPEPLLSGDVDGPNPLSSRQDPMQRASSPPVPARKPSSPPKRARTPLFQYRTPSPPALPDLPTPSTSDGEGPLDTPLTRASSKAKEMQTPKPPGAWLATPKPAAPVDPTDSDEWVRAPDPTSTKTPRPPGGWLYTPKTAPSKAIPPPSDDGESSVQSGLLTPNGTFPRMAQFDPKTPAPPGGWGATPAPRKSILKVRFDSEASSRPATKEEVIKNTETNATTAPLDGSAPLSPTRSRAPKSPGIKVLDAYGREPSEESTVVPNVKANTSKFRVLDALGQEIEDTPSEDDRKKDETLPSNRAILLSRIRSGLQELAGEVDDDDVKLIDRDAVRDLDARSQSSRLNRQRLLDQDKQLQSEQEAIRRSPSTIVRASIFSPLTWRKIGIIIAFHFVLFGVLARIAEARARKWFLNSHYDPFSPDLESIFTVEPSVFVALTSSLWTVSKVTWTGIRSWNHIAGDWWQHVWSGGEIYGERIMTAT